MDIKEDFRGNVAILTLSGKMMGGPETMAVHEHIKKLVGTGITRIVIDLGQVKWMNSSGIGILMASFTTVKSANGDLKLSNIADKIESLLTVTQLLKLFDTHDNPDNAVAAFDKKPW